MEYEGHFRDMMLERNISQEWVDRCVQNPDETEEHDDGTKHYIKQIPEFGNYWLRVIVNMTVTPQKGVTVFFDRRLRRKHEGEG